MTRSFARLHLILLVLCLATLAIPRFYGQGVDKTGQQETKPPSDISFIDPHVHAMSVTPLGLRAVAKWMEERNVEQCIVSPLNHKGSRAWTEE